MRDTFPFLTDLTIPIDAGGTDPRVVIGVPAGTIGIYDSAGRLTGLLSPEGIPGGSSSSPGFFVFDPTSIDDYVALEAIAGFPGITFADSNATVIGRWSPGRTGSPGTTQRFIYTIDTPSVFPASGAELTMVSESDDQTIGVSFDLGATGTAEVTVTRNGRQIPRGQLEGGFLRQTANDAARAAGVNTNATVSPTEGLVSGQQYRVNFHSQANVGTAAVVYALELDYNGVVVGRFGRWSAAEVPVGSQTVFCDGSVEFTAAADDASPTFTVQNSAGSGGTVTLIGNPARTLSVEHIGEP